MSRRLAVLASFVALIVCGLALPASADATYPATGNAIVITSGSTVIVVGGSTTVSAKTFKANTHVTFTVSSPLASLGSSRGGALAVPEAAVAAAAAACTTGSSCDTMADSNGVATAKITFTQAGKQTITATGTGVDGKALTVTSTVTVAASNSSDTSTGPLAKTGTDLVKYGTIGVALIIVGGLIVAAFRRRSHSAA